MDTLNELITRGITNSLQEDITVLNDIYEHPEFSTENDLEGIIFDYGNKIHSIREMARRLDIFVHDYDVYLKDEFSYKLKKFKEKREEFKKKIQPNKSLSEAAHNYIQSDIDATSHFVDDFNVNAPNFSLHDIDDRK